MTTSIFSNRRLTALAGGLTLLAACSNQPQAAPRTDDALRSDLALAAQAQQTPPQQYVSPQELAARQQPYGAVPNGYAPNGYAPNGSAVAKPPPSPCV